MRYRITEFLLEYSTITYDTLVRAGITTVSVFVPETSTAPHSVSPPVAKGSRGINIMPDMYLDRSQLTPVNLPRLEWIRPHIDLSMSRTSSTYLSFQEAQKALILYPKILSYRSLCGSSTGKGSTLASYAMVSSLTDAFKVDPELHHD